MHQTRGIAEEDIISQCRKGNLKYQEMLYKHFYSYAMGVSLRYCFDQEDALEVVNDAFIKVFNAIHSFDSEKPFKAWLRTIVVNTAIDRRRKDLKFQLNVELDHATPAVGAKAIDSLGVQDILKFLNNLPPVQAAIFNLYEIDGYSHDEIAVMMAIPVSSSRVYLSRAKEKLRSLLRSETIRHGRSV